VIRIALETLLERTSAITLSDIEKPVVPVGGQMTARVGKLYLDVTA
jgi:hypothetical protein